MNLPHFRIQFLPEVYDSLVCLREDRIEAAIKANPWFTPYYIHQSITRLTSWFDPRVWKRFLQSYPPLPLRARTIGVIGAGNVPLVALHDVLMVLAAGHRLVLKPSRQDRILMEFLAELLVVHDVVAPEKIILTDALPQADFVLATGSNNTARYLESHYLETPHLIRKARFSVAVIDRELSEAEAHGLAEDTLLYNGQGCRSVSNFLVKESVDMGNFFKIWDDYPVVALNPVYLEKLRWERATRQLQQQSFYTFRSLLLTPGSRIAATPLGVGNMVRFETERELDAMLVPYRTSIQALVGRGGVSFGRAQSPRLDDFADQIDSFSLLLQL